MIDKIKINSKIQYMKTSINRLEELKNVPLDSFIGDFKYFDSAKYNLITAIEALIDICNHIISRENLQIPATNVDSIKILVKSGVLPAEHQDVFVAMARFRNKAVHLYQEINDSEVHIILQDHLDDFNKFIHSIVSHINKQQSG